MTALPVDSRDVEALLRGVAAAEILPRFRNLQAGAVFEKRPGEVVTEADIAAEKWLSGRLTDLLPGSLVVGEEGAEENPDLLHRLESGAVWVVDPVDGTQNFADGKECFAVIVALLLEGETVGGWIYDPVGDVVCHASSEGKVDFSDARPVPAPRFGLALEAQRGALGHRARKALATRGGVSPDLVPRYRCVGREYMDLAAGMLDFVQYGFRLKPWDHLAGELIVRRAGYHVAVAGERRGYTPGAAGIVEGSLIAAADRETWEWIESLIV